MKAVTIAGANHFGLSVGVGAALATASGTWAFSFLRIGDLGMGRGYTTNGDVLSPQLSNFYGFLLTVIATPDPIN